MPDLRITVVIPTFRRSAFLLDTLTTVLKQSFPSEEYEVLVVDNEKSPTPELEELCRSEPGQRIRYLNEPRNGLDKARHAGALAARGDLLVYIDDDVICPEGWLAAMARGFEDPAVMLVGGKTELLHEGPVPGWIPQFRKFLSEANLGSESRRMEPFESVVGCNMAVRRHALLQVGGFNPDVYGDPKLAHLMGDGETGLSRKFHEAGFVVRYDVEAWLHHRVPASRMTLEYMSRRAKVAGVKAVYGLYRYRITRRAQLMGHALKYLAESTWPPAAVRAKKAHVGAVVSAPFRLNTAPREFRPVRPPAVLRRTTQVYQGIHIHVLKPAMDAPCGSAAGGLEVGSLQVSLISTAGLLFLVSHWLWRRSMRSGYSPAGLYVLIWGGTWLVFWSGVMGYEPLTERALWYSALPVLAIFLGEFLALIPYWLTGRTPQKEWRYHSRTLRQWSVSCGALTLFAGGVTLLASWMSVGNVFTHAQELKLARVAMGTGVHSGSALAPVAKYASILAGAFFPATVLGVLRWRLEGRKAWGGLALAFVGVILFDFGWGSRVSTFYFVLLFLTAMFLLPIPPVSRPEWPRKRRPMERRRVLRIVVAAAVLLVAVTALNTVGVKTREKSTLLVGERELPFSLVQLIDYNIGTLSAFDQKLDETTQRTWGRVTFFGFEQWLRLFRIIPRSVPIPAQLDVWQAEYVPILADGSWDRAGNVYTWLRYLYSDFGLAGLAIIPFLVGWLAARSVARGMARNNLWAVCLACALYFTVLTSGGASPFRSDSFVFGLVLSYVGARAITRSETLSQKTADAGAPEERLRHA